MRHTPGPWEAVRLERRGPNSPVYRIQQAVPRYPHSDIAQDARILIAETYSHRFGAADNVPGDGMNDLAHSDREGCQQANAHLIKTSPELLEACRKIVLLGDWTGPAPKGFTDAWEAAMSAIAKAKGN